MCLTYFETFPLSMRRLLSRKCSEKDIKTKYLFLKLCLLMRLLLLFLWRHLQLQKTKMILSEFVINQQKQWWSSEFVLNQHKPTCSDDNSDIVPSSSHSQSSIGQTTCEHLRAFSSGQESPLGWESDCFRLIHLWASWSFSPQEYRIVQRAVQEQPQDQWEGWAGWREGEARCRAQRLIPPPPSSALVPAW